MFNFYLQQRFPNNPELPGFVWPAPGQTCEKSEPQAWTHAMILSHGRTRNTDAQWQGCRSLRLKTRNILTDILSDNKRNYICNLHIYIIIYMIILYLHVIYAYLHVILCIFTCNLHLYMCKVTSEVSWRYTIRRHKMIKTLIWHLLKLEYHLQIYTVLWRALLWLTTFCNVERL